MDVHVHVHVHMYVTAWENVSCMHPVNSICTHVHVLLPFGATCTCTVQVDVQTYCTNANVSSCTANIDVTPIRVSTDEGGGRRTVLYLRTSLSSCTNEMSACMIPNKFTSLSS